MLLPAATVARIVALRALTHAFAARDLHASGKVADAGPGSLAHAMSLNGVAGVLERLEDAARPDGEAARAIRARKIDETFKMNLMYHEEEGWGLLHVACSDRCAPARVYLRTAL